MSRLSTSLTLTAAALLLCGSVQAHTQLPPTQAKALLDQQLLQFQQQIVQTADNVFTAVGYHGATTSMIVGTDGVIIIDTLMGPASANNAFQALRKYSDKPVKAIIYTHAHPDHIGGATIFAGDDNPDIYGRFHRASGHGANDVVNPIMVPRGVRQFGRKLPAHEQTHRGVAQAQTIDHDRGKGHLPPTIVVEQDKLKTTIAGIDIEMYAGPGETDDAMYIWLPNEKVLFAGDNFYQAFPNLYAVRGTPYRDVNMWSNSVAQMAKHKPHYLVGGHTLPIKGQQAATQALEDYSNAIRSVFEQTVAGINQGKGPDQLAYEVKLPKALADKPYLTEFYGNVPNSVRAIYSGLLGWFDGNPTTLNPLAPKAEAKRMAQLAGGSQALAERMQQALAAEDYQWALELADHYKWLDDADRQLAKATKIKALRALGAREYNAPNRNYYLSYANELESGKLKEIWF